MEQERASKGSRFSDMERLEVEPTEGDGKKKKKKKMLVFGAGALFTLSVIGYVVYEQMRPKEVEVVLLHINDHHSHLEADLLMIDKVRYGLDRVLVNFSADAEIYVRYGGFAAIAQAMFNEQASAEAAGYPTFKFHVGDALTGTAYYSLFEHGEVDAVLMNEVCFDGFALGNHEFDQGDQNLAYFLEQLERNYSSNCSGPPAVLAANVFPGAQSPLQNKILRYKIIEHDKVNLGVVGIITRSKTMESSNPDPDTFLTDEFLAAQAVIDELLDIGVRHIVVLSHVGYAFDVELASRLSGVDVILGGDSHTLMLEEEPANILRPGLGAAGLYPKLIEVTENGKTRKVCVAQAWEYSHIVGSLKVDFDTRGEVLACSGNAIVPFMEDSVFYREGEGENATEVPFQYGDYEQVVRIIEQIPQFDGHRSDEAVYARVEEKLAPYKAKVDEKKREKVGEASTKLWKERIPGETGGAATWKQGSDVATVIGKIFTDRFQSGCFALTNGGAYRRDIDEGTISYNDIQEVLPWPNILFEVQMTGQQVQDQLEAVLANIKANPEFDGSFPYGWGIRYNVDLHQGALVSSIEVNCKLAGSWVPLDLNQEYKVVTSNYLAGGKDGYNIMGAIDASLKLDSGLGDLQTVIDHLRASDELLSKPAPAEYSLKTFIDSSGCDHSTTDSRDDCPGKGARSSLAIV